MSRYADLKHEWERETISAAVRDAGGKVGAAAKALGMNRTWLYKRCAQLGVNFRKKRGRWNGL